MPKLILMFKDKILNAYPLASGDVLTIGRHPDNDIVIENLAVSSHHAHVSHSNDLFELKDLDSRNGTQCNGKQVSQCILNDKDVVTIGKHQLQADWSDTMAVERTAELQAELADAVNKDRTMMLESAQYNMNNANGMASFGAGDDLKSDFLSFLAGGEGICKLSKRPVAIGKNPDADIVVGGLWALLMGSPAAVINKQAGDYFLRFAGGMIKPKRNGASVKGTVKLNHEDIIALGPVRVQVQLSGRAD